MEDGQKAIDRLRESEKSKQKIRELEKTIYKLNKKIFELETIIDTHCDDCKNLDGG